MSQAEDRTWLADPVEGAPCTVIAEVAQAHDGSLGAAHAYIDAASRAGADAIKFQTHIADAESTPSEPWRTRFSPQDETRLDYWRRMEFTAEQWHGLKSHADEAGLLFLSSPFSMEAVELLKSVGVAGWKVASGEITNFGMLDVMAATGQPVILSTGMSPWPEIDAAVERIRSNGAPLAILQCTTQYPSPPQSIGVNIIPEFRNRYRTAVGLSDHSGTVFPGLAAVTMGIEVLEVHITMSRDQFGPDVVASVTTDELATLVEGIRFIESMKSSPVDKSEINESIAPLREIFLKSLVPVRDLAAGTVIEAGHLGAKKPGTGIPASEFEAVVGRRLARDVLRDVPLMESDLESQ